MFPEKKKKKSEPVHRDRCEEGKRAWPSFATDFDIYSQGLLSFRSLVLFMLHVLDFVLFLRSLPRLEREFRLSHSFFCSTLIGFEEGRRGGLMKILPGQGPGLGFGGKGLHLA